MIARSRQLMSDSTISSASSFDCVNGSRNLKASCESAMTDAEQTLDEKVDAIPGDDGWWKTSTGIAFRGRAHELVRRGFSEDEAIELLSDLYEAVSEEYGQ